MNQFFRDFVHPDNLKLGIPVLISWVGLLLFVVIQDFAPRNYLLRDPLEVVIPFLNTGVSRGIVCCPPYLGMVSNLGSVMWFIAAAVCGVGGLSVARGHHRRLLLVGAAFSLVLGLDDLFLLHESVLPAWGIPELMILAAYGAIAGVYLRLAFPFRTHRRMPFLATSFFFLSASVAIDVLLSPNGQFWEDAFKFAGIVYWATFHAVFVIDILRRQIAEGPQAGDRAS